MRSFFSRLPEWACWPLHRNCSRRLSASKTTLLTGMGHVADSQLSLLKLGLGLILIGLGFKVAIAPFQIWTPDVYEGAPTPVTALFAAGPKAAAFALLLRIFATV